MRSHFREKDSSSIFSELSIQFIIRLCLRVLGGGTVVTGDGEGIAVFLRIRDLLEASGGRGETLGGS